MTDLSAVLIVRNAELTLARALKSVAFCRERVVVDSGSTDGSAAVARGHGAEVFVRAFDNFASQKNDAIGRTSSDWVFSIDADEEAPPALADEIRSRIESDGGRFAAYRLARRTFFFGKEIRYAGHQDDRPVRLFRKSRARFAGNVHETVVVDGPIGDLRTPLNHFTTATAGDYFKKLRLYTDLETQTLSDRARPVRRRDLWLRPWLRFGEKYVWKLGFLDGWTGFVYSSLSGYYEFVRYAKFWEKSHNLSDKM